MSRSAEIPFFWGDADRVFRLRIRELDKLQERCGERGPKRMLSDLLTGDWKVRDITETIRLGLVGGGMKLPDADKLVREYVEERALEENVLAAVAILQAVLVGTPIQGEDLEEDPPPGKTTAARTASTSPPSTGQGPPSGGVLSKLAS